MADDFYTETARQQLADLEADRLEIQSGLARCAANGDTYSAKEMISGLAELEARKTNLINLHQNYVRSQQPRQAAPMTDSEFLAKSPEKMGAEDVDRIFSKSKYYSKDQWSNPEVSARVNAGIAEVARRQKNGG